MLLLAQINHVLREFRTHRISDRGNISDQFHSIQEKLFYSPQSCKSQHYPTHSSTHLNVHLEVFLSGLKSSVLAKSARTCTTWYKTLYIHTFLIPKDISKKELWLSVHKCYKLSLWVCDIYIFLLTCRSSVGTLILIYLTLRVRHMANGSVHGWTLVSPHHSRCCFSCCWFRMINCFSDTFRNGSWYFYSMYIPSNHRFH